MIGAHICVIAYEHWQLELLKINLTKTNDSKLLIQTTRYFNMGSIFKPKIPSPPPIVMPEPVEDPSYEDEQREAAAKQEMLDAERRRKG